MYLHISTFYIYIYIYMPIFPIYAYIPYICLYSLYMRTFPIYAYIPYIYAYIAYGVPMGSLWGALLQQ